jgi:DNA-directed RNA polymerase subunit M/transcription elongation factor TFIIS
MDTNVAQMIMLGVVTPNETTVKCDSSILNVPNTVQIEILDVLAQLSDDDDVDRDLTGVNVKKTNVCLVDHNDPIDILFYSKSHNRIRRSKIILFGSVLSAYDAYTNMTTDKRTNLLKNLERACYNRTIDTAHSENVIASWESSLFRDIYHSICYKISVNLEPTGLVCNPNLAKNLLNNSISIKNLPIMSSPDMFPEMYVKVRLRIEASKNAKQAIKTTTMYRCGRCKKNMCTFKPLQNRSLDECNNFEVTCVNCGNEFTA